MHVNQLTTHKAHSEEQRRSVPKKFSASHGTSLQDTDIVLSLQGLLIKHYIRIQVYVSLIQTPH
jgi:hypothetical protein